MFSQLAFNLIAGSFANPAFGKKQAGVAPGYEVFSRRWQESRSHALLLFLVILAFALRQRMSELMERLI